MTKTEYFFYAEAFFKGCLNISEKKNADYTGGNADPFANFTSVENLGIKTEQGFLTRMMDKMSRIGAYISKGELQVKNESIIDTLQDLANYSCLFAAYLESKKISAMTVGKINFKNDNADLDRVKTGFFDPPID